jgi:diketogulonate reductase-like aldo/keto reductase
MPNPFIPLQDSFRALNQLVGQGKVRYLGVSNFSLELLKQSQKLSEAPIVTNQIPYSLYNRSYVDNGVLEYCQDNEILITAYSPLRSRDLRVDRTLRLIADSHHATPHQIALAWLLRQPRVITIPMSFNTKHLSENLESMYIELSQMEMEWLSGLG